MSPIEILFALAFVANSAMIVVLAVGFARHWRQLPWLGAFLAYFLLGQIRGVQHIWHMLVTVRPPSPPVGTLDMVLSVASVAILIILVLSTRSMIRGFRATQDAARYREREYERAHRHYTQLVRHRLINPVTIIRGAAITLQPREGVALEPDMQQVLLDAILEASDAIEQATFVPRVVGSAEGDLDPIPDLQRATSAPRLVAVPGTRALRC